MKKILVLCDHGQTRSVAMASLLREAGHFAVTGSYDNYLEQLVQYRLNSGCVYGELSTKSMRMAHEHAIIKLLCERQDYENLLLYYWDIIVFMQEGGEHFIGRDVWRNCTHPELLEKCREKARELRLIQ